MRGEKGVHAREGWMEKERGEKERRGNGREM